MKKNKKVSIKLIGGPHDGKVTSIQEPFESVLKIKSKFRSDLSHLYKFDEDEKNNTFPLAYNFQGYLESDKK